MYSFHCFKMLPAEKQVDELGLHGICLDLTLFTNGTERVLFVYQNFYVELGVERYTDEILSVRCFRSLRKLAPYLEQINITPITALLTCSK